MSATGSRQGFRFSAGFTLPNTAVNAAGLPRGCPTGSMECLSTPNRRGAHVAPDFVGRIDSRPISVNARMSRRRWSNTSPQGVRDYAWLIDPDSGEVEIYRPGLPVEILKRARRRSRARTSYPVSCSICGESVRLRQNRSGNSMSLSHPPTTRRIGLRSTGLSMTPPSSMPYPPTRSTLYRYELIRGS